MQTHTWIHKFGFTAWWLVALIARTEHAANCNVPIWDVSKTRFSLSQKKLKLGLQWGSSGYTSFIPVGIWGCHRANIFQGFGESGGVQAIPGGIWTLTQQLSFVVQDVAAWLIPFLVGYGLSRDWLLSMWIMEWMSMSSVAFSGMHSKILMQAVKISWKESEGMKTVKIVQLQVVYGLSHQRGMLCGDSDASARISTWKRKSDSFISRVKKIQLAI